VSGPVKAVVLGGRTGLLGQALTAALEDHGWRVDAPGRAELDVLDSDALARHLEAQEPDFVFNAVAYTQVDKAEDEPERATLLNKTFPLGLGRLAKTQGFRLIHYSTDFVFDGRAQTPYHEDDETGPASVYGRSKLAGERALLELNLPGLCILRTAWLYGPGKGNFVRTILGLAKEREQIQVVHDQIGSPTYTRDLAAYSLELASLKVHGVFHLVNRGQASWCELAAEAVNLAGLQCQVQAIPSSDYPQKAPRPAYSVLDTDKFTDLTGIQPRPWVQALREYVFSEMAQGAL
jgi:dTDP-4-dehydrorhamnose reductase